MLGWTGSAFALSALVLGGCAAFVDPGAAGRDAGTSSPDAFQSSADAATSTDASAAPDAPATTGTCRTNADCPTGQMCDGPPGCGTAWRCVAGHSCVALGATWCDCEGHTFTTPNSCAGRPYLHEGACETPVLPPDGGACAANGARCTRSTECCSRYCQMMGAVEGVCAAPPPDTVPCGEQLCDAATQYCEVTYSDTPSPDSFTCRAIPPECGGAVSCGCAPLHGCIRCESSAGGTVVLRCPGG